MINLFITLEMTPLELHLAEQLAAAFTKMDAMQKVLTDTHERLSMAIGEVRRLNGFLSAHERNVMRLEQDNTRLITTIARNELEMDSMRAIIRTLQNSVTNYRSESKAIALSSKRRFPRSFELFLEESRERQLNDYETQIREQLENDGRARRNIRRRIDFTRIEEEVEEVLEEEDEEQEAQPVLRME